MKALILEGDNVHLVVYCMYSSVALHDAITRNAIHCSNAKGNLI